MKKSKMKAFDYLLFAILAIILFMLLYPIYYIFVASLSSPLEVYKNPILLYPKNITLYNYRMLVQSKGIWIGYRNTIMYMVIGTALNISVTFSMAYAMSRPYLPAKRIISFFVVFTMFFSGGMIPTFLVVKSLHLLDTIWAVLLPGTVATWNLMITRTYLTQQIPEELYDAAEIDGAGEYRTFWNIVLPLSVPIIVVIVMFYASGHWNAWFNAMIYLRDRTFYPLQIILRELLIDDSAENIGVVLDTESDRALYMLTLKYAVIVVSLLPLMVVFPFVQKYFVKGVMIGAIKG